MPVSLNDTPEVIDQPLSLDVVDGPGTTIDPDVAAQRAFRARFGLSLLNKSYDEIYKDIVGGNEQFVRETAASDLDFAKAQRKNDILRALEKKYPGKLTPNDAITIDAEMKKLDKPTDPLSVFEEQYAKEAIHQLNRTSQQKQDTFLSEAEKVIPKVLENKRVAGETLAAKTEFLRTKAENLRGMLDQQSWIGWGADQLKFMVPTYADFKLRGSTEETSWFSGGLLGQNLENQAKELWQLPFADFKEKVSTVIDNLAKDNPTAAAMYANALLGMSTSDVILNNSLNLIDIATLPIAPVAKSAISSIRGGTRAVELSNMSAQAMRDMVKAAANPNVDKATLVAATGDVAEGAIQKAALNLVKSTKGIAEPTKRALEDLFTYLRTDIQDLKANPGRLSQQQVIAIENRINTLETNLVERLVNDQRVNRLPASIASEESVRAIYKGVVANMKGLEDNILDMPLNVTKEPISNTHFIDVNFGNGKGTLFTSPQEAIQWANWNGLKGSITEQQGVGFYLTVTKPINETDDVVRAGLIETTLNSPDGFLRSFLSWLRTPEDTMSLSERANRKSVTYGPSNLLKLAQEEAREISQLMRGSRFGRLEYTDNAGNTIKISKKQAWNDWERVVRAARNLEDPAVPGQKGYFFKNPAELDAFYLLHLKRLPTMPETEAYFAYKRFNEMDRILRNIAVYRNKTRVGSENHQVLGLDKDGNMIGAKPFDGVIRKDLPGGKDTILVVDGYASEAKPWHLGSIPPKTLEKLKKDIKEGRLKVIEIFDPEARPFSGFGNVTDERIRYVVTNNVQTKPLSWDQVPRRGGGHFEYEYDNYIKQARIRVERLGKSVRHWYEGDTVVMPVSLRSMGADVATKLNEARELLRKGDVDGAKTSLQTNLPAIEWKEFEGWFKPGRDPEGNKIPPRLDLREPFQVISKNKNIVDTDKEALEARYPKTFENGTKEGSLARQYQVGYTAPRDAYELMTLNDVGSRGNPLYKYEPAKLVDPIPAMHKALGKIVNSLYMDDYKISAVERWLQEAKRYLKAEDTEIKYAPFWHFNNVDWKAGARSENPDIIAKLEAKRFQIQQLVGTPSTTDAFLHAMSQKIADSMYTNLGPKGMIVEPAWMLSKLRDPVKFFRTVTYHTAIGLFSVPQLLTQMQTHFTIQAIAGPRYAVPGASAAQMYHFASINKNPAILKAIDDKISAIHLPGTAYWRPGEFTEATNLMERSGFHNVGGEYVNLDNALTPKAVTNGWDEFLDAGTFFFKQGEKNVRYAAFYTAYKEFRAKNPTGRITDADRQFILDRADLLNINMSRASASVLNSGALSLTTQFLTYQIRLAELFFSKRIGETATERAMVRARLLATNAALYGAPTATGVFGLPLADFIRQKATEGGYVIGENYISSLVNEGLPAVMTAIISGKIQSGEWNMQKGTFVNIGDRLGTQGFETINDILRGDKPMIEILGGAAYSKFKGAFGIASPMYAYLMSAMSGDQQSFKMTLDDFVQPLREISSVNIALRSIAAINTGRWMSKNGVYLTDMNSPTAAVILGLTGLQPSEAVVEPGVLTLSKKDFAAAAKKGENLFIKEYRRGLLTGVDGNYEQAGKHFTNAFAYLTIYGVPEEKWGAVISRVHNENEPLVKRMRWDYYVRQPVLDKHREQRLDAHTRQLNLENLKQRDNR